MSAVAQLPASTGPQGGPPGDRPAPTGQRRSRVAYLLLLPGIAWLIVFFLVPMFGSLFSMSLSEGSLGRGYTFTGRWANYTDAWSQYWEYFVRSFMYAGIATVLALVLAYPLAYTIAFKAGRWRGLLLIMVIAPFFTSFLLRTLAWRSILADTGIVADVLNVFTVNDVQLINTPLAVVTGLTYNFLPFMILPLYASLERIDPRLIEAGGDLYASPFTAFRKITFPLSMPGVVAGTLLTFIPAAGDYINAELLGTVRTRMVGNVIDSRFLNVTDYPTAAALSFTLMATIVVLVALYIKRAGTEELV
ncbi:MAG: ABC transporter permease [Sporichthyaceae bacterium]|nr:ABC transporter permease [Sporichthyaceae bacterium]